MSREMDRWLGMQNPETLKSLNVVEYDTPQNVYHISDNASIRIFSPRIPHYRGGEEDATVPRVCVSVSLADTLYGTSYYYLDNPKLRGTTFTLYKFEVSEAIRPTKKILQYPKAIGELWLVPHTLTNYELEPEVVAKVTVVEVKDSDATITLVVNCTEDVPFGAGYDKLCAGIYRLSGIPISGIVDGDLGDSIEVSSMSAKQYRELGLFA